MSPNTILKLKDGLDLKPVLLIRNKTNIIIEGGVIDGNKEAATRTTDILIQGGSFIKILRTVCRNAEETGGNRGDGIYIGMGTTPEVSPPKDITIDGVVCDGNERQGMSVITAKNLRVLNSTFSNTTGHAPGGGIDFEPNTPADYFEDVVLENCILSGNQFGLVMKNSAKGEDKAHRNISIKNNRMTNNRSFGMNISCKGAEGIFIERNIINSNEGWGMSLGNFGATVVVRDNHVHDNGQDGIKINMNQSSSSYLVESNEIYLNGYSGIRIENINLSDQARIIISKNRIYNSSTSNANTYDGIFVISRGNQYVDVTLSENLIGNSTQYSQKPTQRYGINLARVTAKDVKVLSNKFKDNLMGEVGNLR